MPPANSSSGVGGKGTCKAEQLSLECWFLMGLYRCQALPLGCEVELSCVCPPAAAFIW